MFWLATLQGLIMDLLKVETAKDKLVISIGLDALKCSLEAGRLDMLIGGEFKVTDMDAFMKEFKRYLMCEEEDGSTPIHLMLDQVAAAMLEDTDEGCEITDC